MKYTQLLTMWNKVIVSEMALINIILTAGINFQY